jgi:hypothetical protein
LIGVFAYSCDGAFREAGALFMTTRAQLLRRNRLGYARSLQTADSSPARKGGGIRNDTSF